MIPCAIQARAGQNGLLWKVYNVPAMIGVRDTVAVQGVLDDLAEALSDITNIFRDVDEFVDAADFYDLYVSEADCVKLAALRRFF